MRQLPEESARNLRQTLAIWVSTIQPCREWMSATTRLTCREGHVQTHTERLRRHHCGRSQCGKYNALVAPSQNWERTRHTLCNLWTVDLRGFLQTHCKRSWHFAFEISASRRSGIVSFVLLL